MATRLYPLDISPTVLTNSSAEWENTNGLLTFGMSTILTNFVQWEIGQNDTPTTNNRDCHLITLVSDPLAAQTIPLGITFSGLFFVREREAADNLRSQIIVRLVTSTGADFLTLYDGDLQTGNTNPTDEWYIFNGQQYQTMRFPRVAGSTTRGTISNIPVGCRLVVELGYRKHQNDSVYGSIMLDNNTTYPDATGGELWQNTKANSWIDFSYDFAFQKSASDTGGVSTSESASAKLYIPASDLGVLSTQEGFAEGSPLRASLPASDAGVLVGVDGRALATSQARSDAGAISAVESSSIIKTRTISTSDASTVAVAESAGTSATRQAGESPALSITESVGIAVARSATDAAALSIAESPFVSTSASVADVGAIAASESAATSAMVHRDDAASIAASEGVVFALSASDALGVSASVSPAVSASRTINDMATAATQESVEYQASVVTSESGAVSITDAASRVESGASAFVSDVAAITSDESASSLSGTAVGDESLVSTSESWQVSIASSIGESATLASSESATTSEVGSSVSRLDSATITIADDPSLLAYASAEESAFITSAESSSPYGSGHADDGATLGIYEEVDTRQAGAVRQAADASAISLSGSPSLSVAASVDDASDIVALAAWSSSSSRQAADQGALTLDESATPMEMGATPTVGDTGEVSLSESLSIARMVAVGDAAAVGVDDTILTVAGVPVADAAALDATPLIFLTQIGESRTVLVTDGATLSSVDSTEMIAFAAPTETASISAPSLAGRRVTYQRIIGLDSGVIAVSGLARTRTLWPAVDVLSARIDEAAYTLDVELIPPPHAIAVPFPVVDPVGYERHVVITRIKDVPVILPEYAPIDVMGPSGEVIAVSPSGGPAVVQARESGVPHE